MNICENNLPRAGVTPARTNMHNGLFYLIHCGISGLAQRLIIYVLYCIHDHFIY